MITFFILVGISLVGTLVVFWLLKNEDKPSLRDFETPMAAVAPPAEKPPLFAGLFAKFKKEKIEAMADVPLPSVTDFVEKSFVVYRDDPQVGPAAPQALSAAEEKKIEQEIDLAAKIEEWKGKYERLDKIFNEKSAALAKSEESLQNELSNRKEFNKLKDMLEKELREAKDKARSVQVELNAAKTDAEGSKKRIAQLEEKITKMEKAILGKDDEIADLAKRLQAAARIPPVTAAAPESEVKAQPPQPPAAPVSSNDSSEPVEAPSQITPVEPSDVSRQAPEPEPGFLKLQPDILVTTNPPVAPAAPETQGNEPGGSIQAENSVPPEANSQEAQGKPVSQEETNKNKDEQKAAP